MCQTKKPQWTSHIKHVMAFPSLISLTGPSQIHLIFYSKVATYRKVCRPELEEPPHSLSCIGSEHIDRKLSFCTANVNDLPAEIAADRRPFPPANEMRPLYKFL